MDNNIESLEGLDLGFRRTTHDKLNWKLEIQKRLDICIATYGTPLFFKNVERLTKTIVFNIHGYKFKDTILTKMYSLQYMQILKEEFYKRYRRDDWFHPISKQGLILDLKQDYHEQLYDFVCQLIAEKGLLLDTDVYTPIRMKKRMDDMGYEE